MDLGRVSPRLCHLSSIPPRFTYAPCSTLGPSRHALALTDMPRPLLHVSGPLHVSRSCPAPFFAHPDVYPHVLAAPTRCHAITFMCRPCLHIEPSATQDDSPRPKRVSFDGAELAQVFEADEWDRSPAEVTLRLTYKDVIELRELNVSLVRNGPLMMECTPSRMLSRRPTRQHCTFSGHAVRSHRTGPSRHHVMVTPRPMSPRPHRRPLPCHCLTRPPRQLTPSKRAGVPCPSSLHVPSPCPRATDTLPFQGTLAHTVPMHQPTPHAYQCADGQPPRTCPGPSDSPAPSRHAGAIQACVRATLRRGHSYTKILRDRGEPNRRDTLTQW